MTRRFVVMMVAGALLVGACGGGDDAATTTVAAEPRLEQVTADAAEGLLASPPDGLVVLDVRTPGEFAEGHIAGADNIDFYAANFPDLLAELDPNAPYFVYCRSGNRSGTTVGLMRDLGFTQVYELGGGILTWVQVGLPLE